VANPFLELDQLNLQAAEFALVIALFTQMQCVAVDRLRQLVTVMIIHGRYYRFLRMLLFTFVLAAHLPSSKLLSHYRQT
jgi:hypothetical protein